LASYREVRGQFLGKNAPASTLLVVAGLAQPNILVEVEVVAAKE
jgi:enamine deaminase RidA (YjgF/YER057c/UK114 family)